MEFEKWNNGWIFWDERTPENKKKVTLPHDAMLEEKRLPGIQNGAAAGYFPGGRYNYKKTFWGRESWEDQIVMLEFEGVYMKSSIFLNGEKVGGRIYGYSDFYVNLTGRIKIGEENELLVVADNTQTPNSRWYTGSGIYRDVYLLSGNRAHILPDGIKVVTEQIHPAILQIEIEVSETAKDSEVEIEVCLDNEVAARTYLNPEVYKGVKKCCKIRIEDARLWSSEEPNLYTIRTVLKKAGNILDIQETRTGIRLLEWNASYGMKVNGKSVKLRGGCVHHDHGALGACGFYAAELRRAKILKEAGYNAVRYAHNPASKTFLDACDEVGLYVMDEAFDQWKEKQSPYDYGMYFESEWEKDLESMILKARNHPSVVMYSIGNEISDISKPEGAEIGRKLTALCHKLDPSRPTLNAVNPVVAIMGSISKGETSPDDIVDPYKENKDSQAAGSLLANIIVTAVPFISKFMGKPKKVEKLLKESFDAVDIVGYNYAEQCYQPHHDWNPSRIMVGSETYIPKLAENWEFIKSVPYVIGDFMWTAWDYLGEAGVGAAIYGTSRGGFNRPYPCVSAGCGAIDKTGYRETSSYYAAIIWGEYKKPYIGVRPVNRTEQKYFLGMWRYTDTVHSWSWTGMDGNLAEIEVFSPGKEVELIQDGTSLGRKKVQDYVAKFKTTYRSGFLEAIAYDEAGIEIGRDLLSSAGKEKTLTICPEQKVLKADGEDLLYVAICITDADGETKMLCDERITVTVEGAAELAGVCSGNPFTEESFLGDGCETWYGRMLAILRSNGNTGEIYLKASAKGVENQIILHAVEKKKMINIRHGMNPFLPGKVYIPDGEPHIFGDRLYLYGSHDKFEGTGYCQEPYIGWSAPVNDLTDWRYEGVILEKGLDPLDPDGDKSYYAPDAVQGPDGRFYLYYSIEGSSVISVAVCDEPAGKYQFYGHVKDENGHVLGSVPEDTFQFDPVVLVDDGHIYLYSGQDLPVEGVDSGRNAGAQVCELETDMVTMKTRQTVLTSWNENRFEENPFFEASSIRKFGNQYYFIYSSLPNMHNLCYAVSDYPDKGFRYGGVLISNGDIFAEESGTKAMNYWGNNHGSIVEVKGQHYIFYHRHTNKSGWCRQACAEQIQRNPDGTFEQAELTSSGLYRKGLPLKGTCGCYTACHLKKKDMPEFQPFQFLTFDKDDPYLTQEKETEIPFIANFRKGSSADYRYFIFTGEESKFSIIVRGDGKGKIKVMDMDEHQLFAEVTVGPSEEWNTSTAKWQAPKGNRGFRIIFEGQGYLDMMTFTIE